MSESGSSDKFKVKKQKKQDDEDEPEETKKGKKSAKTAKISDKASVEKKFDLKTKKSRLGADSAVGIMMFMIFFLSNFVFHSNMLASEAYSSPSIILSGRRNDGSRYIIDDFREAYYWMKQNTPKDSKIMSWWDYGY